MRRNRSNEGKKFSPHETTAFYDDNTPSVRTYLIDAHESTFRVDEVRRDDEATLSLQPGSTALVDLVFGVGFLKDGTLNLTLNDGQIMPIKYVQW